MKKFFIVALISAGLLYASNMYAQVVDTKPKPPKVKVEKSPKPTTMGTWVWVPGHWVWKKKSKKYVWTKARWKKAPKGKKYWKKGHWKKVKKGWEWAPGKWE